MSNKFKDNIKSFSLLFGYIYFFTWGDGLWFRIKNGYGLHIKKYDPNAFLLFSERNNLVKTYKVFGYVIKFLKP